MHRIITAVFAFLTLFATPLQAQGYDRLNALLSEAGCLSHPTRYYASLSGDGAWLLLSAFSGQSLVSLGKTAGWSDIRDFLDTGGKLSSTDDSTGYAETLLHENWTVLNRIEAEFDLYGTALCPLVQAVLKSDLSDVAARQIHERDYWQPLAATAQTLLMLKDCGALEPDGFFGPASRDAWARSGLSLSNGALPTPGEIVQLANAPRACGTPPLPATLAFIAHCDHPTTDALIQELAGLVRRSPGTTRAAMAPSLGACWFDGLTVAHTVAILGALASPSKDFADHQKVAIAMREALLETAREDGLSGPDPLLEVAIAMWETHGTDPQGLFGLALAEQAVAAGAYHALDMRTLEDVEAAPLPPDVKTSLLVGLRAGYIRRLDAAAFRDVSAQVSLLRLEASLPIEAVAPYLDAVRALSTDATFRSAVLEPGHPDLNYALGTLILEGHGGLPRDFAEARAQFGAAASQGHGASQYRLARMMEFGQGAPADPLTARALMEEAALNGDTAALVFLAKADEADPARWPDAAQAYGTVFYNLILRDQYGPRGPQAAAALVRDRMLSPSGFWAGSGPGQDILAEFGAQLDTPRSDDYDQERTQLEHFASAMGEVFADSGSGFLLDLDKARLWWRRAGDGERLAQVSLGTGQIPDDIVEAVRDSLRFGWISARDKAAFLKGLDVTCPAYGPEVLYDQGGAGWSFVADWEWAEAYRNCVHFARDAGLGMVDPELTRPAIEWLETRAAIEWEAIAQLPRLETAAVPLATLALADLRAFFGDYASARDALSHVTRVRQIPGDWAEHYAWKSDRAVARHLTVLRDGDPSAASSLRGYLLALAARGHPTAARMVTMLDTPPAAPRRIGERAALEARIAQLASLGPSRAYANAARDLAGISAAEGDIDLATEYHLAALEVDLTRSAAMYNLDGPFAATMTAVCSLSRTSEALFALDQRDLALSLVKDAVNRLQVIRADLAGLPEDLRLCFRDQVAGHYRWLADLLIAENRAPEASQVLQMLKEFELFQFTARAPDQVRGSFELLPVTEADTELVTIALSTEPPAHDLAIRRDTLRRKGQGATLSIDEKAELDEIEAELAAFAQTREATRAALSAAAEAAGRADAASRIAPQRSIKRFLRGFDGKAAVLQYVVLEDRMGAVLTTATTQTVHSWDELQGEAFSEAALNALIAQYRSVLQSPDVDAAPTASRLGAAVLSGDILAELEAAGIDTLIVAPDRQLRYIPFAALHDGTGWLAERFTFIQATSAGVAAGTDRADRVAAFGTTEGWGFAPLPGVADEVNAIVAEGAGDPGLMQGAARLNAAFTQEALVDALVFSDLDTFHMGIVHLATHFKLGPTEAESFLLMGDGSRLSLETVRSGFGVDMDFSEVAVLTLSACETAFGTTTADGRELESFAAIAQDLGAQSVLASLWPISDQSTAWIMERTYGLYVEGASLPVALAQAQRELLSFDPAASLLFGDGPTPSPRWTHPYYWAPFTVLEGAI